jgi:hypothetical protein
MRKLRGQSIAAWAFGWVGDLGCRVLTQPLEDDIEHRDHGIPKSAARSCHRIHGVPTGRRLIALALFSDDSGKRPKALTREADNPQGIHHGRDLLRAWRKSETVARTGIASGGTLVSPPGRNHTA